MPQRRNYSGAGAYPQAPDMGEMFNLGRMIRDQVSGREKHQEAMDREFQGLELEEAQAKVMELKGRQRRQQIQDQLGAAQLGRQGDIQAAEAMQGTPGPTLASMMGGQRQAQLQGAAGQPDVAMNLPIPNVQLPHPTQQVRGIQIPEAGIDVPGYETRPQTLQQVLQQQKEAQDVKDMVDVPEELRNLGQTIDNFPALPARMNKEVLDLVLRLVSQLSMGERQGKQLGATAEQGGLNRGSREKVAGMGVAGRAGLQDQKLGATATENEKKRLSIEEQKAKDRASREKIASMKGKSEDGSDPDLALFGAAGAQAAPSGLDAVGRPFASSHAPTGIKSRIKGGGKKMNLEMAKKYLEEAGGDKEQARKWAREDGWVL